MINIVALSKTMVAPVGKSKTIEMNIPIMTLNKEKNTANTMVCLNPVPSLSAITVGNIIKLDISIVPTTLMPSTMVIDVRIAISWLIRFVLMPRTFAKSISYVTAKKS